MTMSRLISTPSARAPAAAIRASLSIEAANVPPMTALSESVDALSTDSGRSPERVELILSVAAMLHARVLSAELTKLKSRIDTTLSGQAKLDAYTQDHLQETSARIAKVVDAKMLISP